MGVVYLGGADRLYEAEIEVQRDTLAWAQSQKIGGRSLGTIAPVTGAEFVHLWNQAHAKKKRPSDANAELAAWASMEGG